MKKIILLVLLLALLVGCNYAPKNDNYDEDDNLTDIQIAEIERFDFEWDQVEFPFDPGEDALAKIAPIGTSKEAVDIATAIINALHEDGRVPEYVLLSVTHSTEENIWCFEYSIDQRNFNADSLVECGGLYIAVDGNEGELIKAWVEE